MIVKDLEQGSREWLDFRKDKISATDASIIMGTNPYKTPLKLWRQKMGIDDPDFVNPAMLRGSALEPKARKAFEEWYDLDLEPVVIVHDSIPWIMASLDGYDGRHLLEIKCPGEKVYAECKAGNIPKYWLTQIQHQLICTGLTWAYLYIYDGTDGFCREVEFDEENAQALLTAEAQFYRRLQEFDPPEDKYQTRKDLEWMRQADRTARAKIEYEKAKKFFEEEREKLIDLAGDASVEGGGVRVCRSFSKGNINYKAIPEIQKLDLEKYRGKGSERVTVTFGISSIF